MSDHKPTDNQYKEDMKELFELLDRLEQRDKMQQQQIFANPQPVDLITGEESDEEEEFWLSEPAQFQINNLTAVDARDLLLTGMEEPLEMSEYIVADDEVPLVSEDEDELPERPETRRNPFKVLWSGFCSNFPKKGDSVGTKVRKCGFLTSLLVMLLAIVYLAVDLVVIPAKNEQLKQELIALYHPEKSQIVITKEEAEKSKYPVNMLASFTELYDRNSDVRGWIEYHASGEKDFLNIDYPIVYSGDNDEYLKKDFNGEKNRNGTLFFDQNNKVNSYKDQNRSLIVYGHNMASGQMFAGLNKLLGSVNNARASATLTLSTLFREDKYQVFAVILTDESDKKKGRYFNTRRTTFEDDADFLDYIDQMKARSLFDYPVEVEADDQILVLSTCTGKTSAHVKDGRLVVVARRVRDGEDATIKTSSIVKNSDVIMPYYWYINQKKTPHKYYTDKGLDTAPTETSGDSTAATGESTTTTVGSTTATDNVTETTGSTDATGTTESTDATESTTTEATNSTTAPTTTPTTEPTTTAGTSTTTKTDATTTTAGSSTTTTVTTTVSTGTATTTKAPTTSVPTTATTTAGTTTTTATTTASSTVTTTSSTATTTSSTATTTSSTATTTSSTADSSTTTTTTTSTTSSSASPTEANTTPTT